MRIHAIRTLNLNSLYGTQSLDLDRDLAGHSLFLIRGETGAGKSTILDAISLALFGRTARLAATSARKDAVDDADPALVLSDGTGEGSAEVDFSVLDGGVRHHWRARWSVARARGKADGALQKVKRTLIRLNAVGDELQTLVSSDKRKDFEAPFELALCGLDWEDFSRTVMLAQGQFQQFLRSDHKERAELLERLTGTQEYAAIGMRASERKRQVDAQVTQLEGQIGGVVVLTDAQVAELVDKQRELEVQENGARERGEEVRRFVEWLNRDADLRAQKERQELRLAQLRLDTEAFAPSRERLLAHQRTEPAAQWLTRWRDAEKEHTARAEKLGVATEQVNALSEAEAARSATRQVRAQELDQARAHAQTMEPQIALARAAWAARGAALQQFNSGSETLKKKESEQLLVQEKYNDTAALLQARRASFDELKASLAAYAGSEQLIAQLPMWTSRLGAWTAAAEQAERLQQEIATLEAKQLGATERLSVLRQTVEAEVERQAAARLARELAEQARVELTFGATAAEFRERRDEDVLVCREQSNILDGLIQLADRCAARLDERAGIMAQIDVDDATMELLNDLHAKARAVLDRLNAEHDRLLEARDQLGLVLEIVERRAALAEGEACPLCGSMDHPYRTGAAVPPDDSHYRAERERALKFLEAHRNEIRVATEHEKKCESDILLCVNALQRNRARTHELSLEIEALQDQIRELQDAPTLRVLEPENGWTGIEFALVRSEVNDALANIERQLKELQRLADAESAAETALVSAELRVSKAAADLHLAESEASSSVERHEALRTDLTRVVAQVQELAQQMGSELAQHAWLAVTDPLTREAARAAIGRAEVRLAEWRAMTVESEKLDAEVRQWESTVEGTRATLETSEKALHELREAVAGYSEALESAELQVATHLDGRSPDEVAAELTRMVDESQQRLGAADHALNAARLSLETARTSEQSAASEVTTALHKLREAEVSFTDALSEVGLASVDELQKARLSPEEWQSLSRRAQQLDDERNQAEGAARAVSEQLAASQLSRPHTMPPGASADELAEEGRALAETGRELVAELARIRAALQSNAEQGERLGELVQQLAERRVEAERWKLIDELIGTTDGSKFRKLAQGYHLVELADFANLRLEKLSDRYRLRVRLSEHGAPTMDFMVQDAHQADRERPLTTLSGGETFMVSLALALALSDFRAVRMPIETVLIDEGFGTLDPVTLNTVVQALENLQSSTGARVGIISHVSGLSERIGGRVLVKRKSAGRSEIVVEKGD